MKWCSALAILVLCAACGGGQPAADPSAGGEEAAQPAGAEAVAEPAPPAPRYRDVTVPAGTTLRLELASAVATDSSAVEDPVRATLRDPVVVDGREVVPAGAELSGHVTDVERSGRVKGRAAISYRFDALRAGEESHEIQTAAITHRAPATKGEDAAKIAIGAGAGAALGAVLGGGSGAAKGAAIGGAGGTGLVLATRGEEVHVGPGTQVTARLTAPLTLRVPID